jgi:hypothetical protein
VNLDTGIAPTTPALDVVAYVLAALAAGQWERVADAVEPASLDQFRSWELRFIGVQMRSKPRSREQMAEDLPGAPEAVVNWFADQEAAGMARERRWTPGLLGVKSFAALGRLSARELFVRWLAASYQGAIPWQTVPPHPPRLHRLLLGFVPESRPDEELAHVLYREQDNPRYGDRVRTTTLVLTPGGWRVSAVDTALLLPADDPE